MAFHDPGLPSLVIIGKDGRLARYHWGFLEEMATAEGLNPLDKASIEG